MEYREMSFKGLKTMEEQMSAINKIIEEMIDKGYKDIRIDLNTKNNSLTITGTPGKGPDTDI